MMRLASVTSLGALWLASSASAYFYYSDLADFVAATSATSASGSLAVPPSAPDYTWGSVRVTLPAGSTIALGEWTSRLDGEFAINGVENLNYDFASPVFAAGFRFVEPQFDPNVNGTFIHSAFNITLLRAGSVVHLFSVSRPTDVASFIGVWSGVAFDRMEVREVNGGAENEFFGEVFTGTDVPTPGAGALLGLGGFFASRRRR